MIKLPKLPGGKLWWITFGIAWGFLGTAAADPCTLCPNGKDFIYPDAKIPYFVLPGDGFPTCSTLAIAASMLGEGSMMCIRYKANAGFCGCPDIEPQHICSFCPNGGVPARSNLRLPSGNACRDLYTYVSYFNEDQCNSIQYDAIIANDAHCGCQDPATGDQVRRGESCTFCPDGSFPPEPNFKLELAGLSCGEYAAFINTLSQAECDVQAARGTFDLFSFQCQCPGTTPPACSRQENPQLCTVSLLRTVEEEACECYSFCDGEFVGCDSYPGNFLGSECQGVAISGCNFASAIDDSGTCHLCPDFTNSITNPEAVLPPFSGVTIPGIAEPTCRDVVNYIEQPNTEEVCEIAQSRLAYYCGCKGARPSCTLCSGGMEPSFKDVVATGDVTCKEFANTVSTWEPGTCEIGESYLEVMAARCGCVTAQYPVCPVNENPSLCTLNLLRSTEENCACYNFCGSEFHSCSDYPGQVVDTADCPSGQTPIFGCNQALATSHRCTRGSLGPCNSSQAPPTIRAALRRKRL
ncbi:hypothetical protein IV203_029346 [Nitzschia inconspicua]|uniref:Uncharacterized protein n=1 Tax=Nitzschia inconspicua TaxID=303405 RepID=A0A9K3LU47_9STRA|nr:hypothetical protein IV203_029346 [Nitzschia inconspicua]